MPLEVHQRLELTIPFPRLPALFSRKAWPTRQGRKERLFQRLE